MIRVIRGDLAVSTAEAILRPVSAEWTAVTPAMRRLELAAGPELERQCRGLGELPVGSAVITPAGQLAARFMVHVIVRSVDEPVSPAGVRRGLENGLRRLAEWGVQHVAMAPLGTGAGNLEPDDAAALMIGLLAARGSAEPPREVDIHVDSDYEFDVFQARIMRLDGTA